MLFLTSDLHLGHARINELAGRPFDSVDEMNSALISNWNDVVDPTDSVIVLGDFVMGKKDETLPLVELLNGMIYLVPGNHDRVFPTDRQLAKWTPLYTAVGIRLLPAELSFGPLTLSHFPFDGDSHGEDRYSECRPTDRGQLLLHGHVHESWKVRGRQINVGVDVWDFAPVEYDRLLAAYTIENESTDAERTRGSDTD